MTFWLLLGGGGCLYILYVAETLDPVTIGIIYPLKQNDSEPQIIFLKKRDVSEEKVRRHKCLSVGAILEFDNCSILK